MAPVLGGWKLWPWHFCILQVSSVWPRPSLSQCAQATWLLNGRAFCPDCRGVSGSRTGNRSGARSGKREGTPPRSLPTRHTRLHVTVASEPERIGVFLTRSCVHVTDISCGVVYEATLASLVLFRSYCYVSRQIQSFAPQNPRILNDVEKTESCLKNSWTPRSSTEVSTISLDETVLSLHNGPPYRRP